MKLDGNLTEGVAAAQKVVVDLLLLDSLLLSLDDDCLRSRSKSCAALGSTRKGNPCERRGPDHHSDTGVGANHALASWGESAGEGAKKSLEQVARTLSESTSKHAGATVAPLHLSCSCDRVRNSSTN